MSGLFYLKLPAFNPDSNLLWFCRLSSFSFNGSSTVIFRMVRAPSPPSVPIDPSGPGEDSPLNPGSCLTWTTPKFDPSPGFGAAAADVVSMGPRVALLPYLKERFWAPPMSNYCELWIFFSSFYTAFFTSLEAFFRCFTKCPSFHSTNSLFSADFLARTNIIFINFLHFQLKAHFSLAAWLTDCFLVVVDPIRKLHERDFDSSKTKRKNRDDYVDRSHSGLSVLKFVFYSSCIVYASRTFF